MAYTIASIPFWLIGAFAFAGALIWMVNGFRGKEPIFTAAANFGFGIMFAGGCFAIAAHLIS